MRATRFAGVLFGVGFAFWELFSSVHLFGEPVFLLGLELVFWLVIDGAEAINIAVVNESKQIEKMMT